MGLEEGLVTEGRVGKDDMRTGQAVDDNMKTGVDKMATTTITTTVIGHSDTTTTITTITTIIKMSHSRTGVDLKGTIIMMTTTNSEEGTITVMTMATTTTIVIIAKIGSLATITTTTIITITTIIMDNTNNKESNLTHQRAYRYRISQRDLFLNQIQASRRMG